MYTRWLLMLLCTCRRDCISVTVYYAKSGATTWSELVEQLPTPNERFQQFIHCLGWTVSLPIQILIRN